MGPAPEPAYRSIRVGGHDMDQVKRWRAFVEAHPEWSTMYVRSMGYYEGVRDDPNTVITDYDLRTFLDKLERATPKPDEE